MRSCTQRQILLCGRRVQYDAVASRTARHTRVRVGPKGIEVLQPAGISDEEVSTFLRQNENWVLAQVDRTANLRALRRPDLRQLGEILYRGEPTPVRIEFVETKAHGNLVRLEDGQILVRRGAETQTPAARGLENWLRRQARAAIANYLPVVTARISKEPKRVYVMDQRTKWGNCSSLKNLSFNWRLILAPEFVLRYLITHETVHLAIPDHSVKFWLAVQSLCPETERAKQWLSRHHAQIMVDLPSIFEAERPIQDGATHEA